MLSATLIVSAFAALIFSKKLFQDYFSPPAIYAFFWCVSLGLLELDWVDFDPLGAGVWKVMGVSFLSFITACLAVGFYGLARRDAFRAPQRLAYIDRGRFERALLVLFCLGIVGFIVQLVHLQMSFGLATFITDPQTARAAHTNVKYLGFFNILNLSNFALGVLYLAIYRKPKTWVVAILVWAFLTTLVTTDRTRFFYMVIWSFYIVVYSRRVVHLNRTMIVSVLVTAGALVGFFLLIAKVYVKQAYDGNAEFINLPSEYALLVDPYIYMTGSYPVLQAFLEDEPELYHGKYTFEPIVKFIEFFYPPFHRAPLVGKFYQVPIDLNVCTYLQPFYLDWGYAGFIIGPFLCGLLAMSVYLKMRARKTLFSVYFAGLMSFCVTISIFVNFFSQIATWFFVAVGLAVALYVRSEEPRSREALRPMVRNES